MKKAEALEVFGKVNTLVVDKTGTLTEGKPKLLSVLVASRPGPRSICCASPRVLNGAANIRWLQRWWRERKVEGSRAPQLSSFVQ